MISIRRLLLAAVVSSGLTSGAFAQALNAETPPSTSESAQLITLLAKYAKDEDVVVRVNSGQTLSKSVLNVASGRTELAVSLPGIESAFRRGAAMYSKISDQAKELAPNLRSVFGWTGGASMLIAYDGSGIADWSDLKGKRVYMGPPGSNATRNHEISIELTSGLVSGEDYTPVYMGFTEGRDAIRDGLVDAGFVMGAPLTAQNKLMFQNKSGRVIGFNDEHLADPEIRKYLNQFGTVMINLPNDTYELLNNETEVALRGFTQNLLTHKDMDEDTVYKLTKAFWENAEETAAVSALLAAAIDTSNPMIGISTPLHPGAVRYYQEIGMDVPDRLIVN